MAQLLGVTLAVNSLSVFTGHAYGAEPPYRFGRHTVVALHTVTAFFIVALGVLKARPGRRVMGLVTASTLGVPGLDE